MLRATPQSRIAYPTLVPLQWVLVVLLSGCSTYLSYHQYTPQPGEINFDANQEDAQHDARAIVSVLGVRRSVEGMPKHRAVDLKLRIENLSQSPITFDPGRMVLLSSLLNVLPGPHDAPKPAVIPPGGELTQQLTFLFPTDTLGSNDLEGFNLRLTLEIDSRRITRSISFTREYNSRDDRYYYQPYYFHEHYDFLYHRYRYR